MANKTFGDLPARSNITSDDFFITNRTSDVNFPEARTGINILTNYLYPGLIVKNTKIDEYKYFNPKVTKQAMDIKLGSELITFKDPKNKKSVHGLFQIEATQTKGSGINIPSYSLSYVRNDSKFSPIVFYTDKLLDISKPQHLFIDPFIPESPGKFQIQVSFLTTNPSQQYRIESSILLFETF